MKYPKFIRVIRKRSRALIGNNKPLTKSEMIKRFILSHRKSFIVSQSLSFNVESAVYFDAPIASIYQIKQWVRPFILLNKKHPLIILARHKAVYDWVVENTDIPVVYLRGIDDLHMFYEKNSSIKCVLYVNHAFKNFQSLINNDVMHVHINHGESDKTSTTTNQVKAYDRVFIVADAACNKYANNLLEIDMSKFIKIGRPQLDGVEKLEKPSHDRKIILYAPTWEGTHQSMDFSSVHEFGASIVKALLESEEYFLIYRPHPLSGKRESEVARSNNSLMSLVEADEFAHVDLDSDCLSLCELADLAIFDNSAVAVDYLLYNKPFLLTDLFSNQEGIRSDKPLITQAAKVIDHESINGLKAMIDQELVEDTMHDSRAVVRRQFIGDFEEGESTEKFITEVSKIISTRDKLVHDRDKVNCSIEA